VQPEFAVDSVKLGRLDQPRVRYGDRVQRTIQLLNPEVKKFVQLGKLRKKIEILPDVRLQ